MRQELEAALGLARRLPPEELPALIGALAEVSAVATARLAAPAVADAPDTLLEVPEAAARLGISPDYLYRHSKKFPFTRRMGRKLLFSSVGVETYLKREQ